MDITASAGRKKKRGFGNGYGDKVGWKMKSDGNKFFFYNFLLINKILWTNI